MYTEYYNFSNRPFQLCPDHRFFFGSAGHRRAMAYLRYGIEQGEGFIVITGEIGAGKSTLVEALLKNLPSNNLVAASLVTSQLDARDMLALVAAAFGLEIEGRSKAELLSDIETFLKRKAWEDSRVLLVVDEAQNICLETLEELRMLSNYHISGVPLMQTFLLGQPDFIDTLRLGEMKQLRQRVIASYHLRGLKRDEVEPYIEHRLSLVGWKGDPSFSDEACERIYTHTGGIPRNVNKLCDRVLLYGSLEELHSIDGEVVETVFDEMDLEVGTPIDNQASEVPETEERNVLRGRIDSLEERVAELEYALELERARLRALNLEK